MNDIEIVMDLISELVRQTGVSIQSLTHDELTWQPDPHGNNIAVTVWQYTRWWDVLAVRAFQIAPGLGGSRTYYDWIKEIGTSSFRHVGEIQTLKALRQRL